MNVRNVLIVPLVLAVLTTPALAKKHNHTDGLNQTGDPVIPPKNQCMHK